jgi:Spy/CpxP family protein refolding chaperone
MVDHMARELKLTDAQKASFKAIFAKHKDSLKAKGQAIREAHEAYRAALEKPDTPPDTLKTMNRSLADLKFERRMEARTMHQELRAVLTPEQREKAARMEGRMEGMRKARGGMGGGCGSMGCGPWGKRPGPMTPPPPAPAP